MAKISSTAELQERCDFAKTKAIGRVIIAHATGLHEGEADRGAHEFETVTTELLAHGFCAVETVAVVGCEAPDVVGETGILAVIVEIQDCARVGNYRVDLLSVTNHRRVVQDCLHPCVIEVRNVVSVKIFEDSSVTRATAKNGEPTETRLCAFQGQEFKESRVVVHRHAPLSVVIRDVEFVVATPRAAGGLAHFNQ